MEDLITTKELADRLGIARGTVQNWRSQKSGPPYKRIGAKAIRYRLKDVLRWMEGKR